MRRITFLLALCLMFVPMTPASAITHGQPDGERHPNVGGLLHAKQYSDGTWIDCSGTLISPTVFLTAAHCGRTGKSVSVTFASNYQAGDTTYAGTFKRDRLYNQRSNDPHDIAVVLLDEAVRGIAPARLPRAHAFDKLAKDSVFVPVGYGAYEVTNQPGGHRYLYKDERRVTAGTLNTVNKSWLRISMNPATAA